MVPLIKKDILLLRPSVGIALNYFEYKIGTSYSEPGNTGIIVEGHNIGSSISKISYVNRDFSLAPGADLILALGRCRVTAGLAYNVPFHAREFIDFHTDKYFSYKSNCNSDNYIYDYSGHILHDHVVDNLQLIQFKLGIGVILD